MNLELTQAEHSLLVSILEERQRDLLHEISRTGLHSFKRTLRERESVLETLLRKVAPERDSFKMSA
ncbi:MAG: hypothetical protein ACRD3Q_14785 [Terriglobales bacterium]